MKSGQLKAGYGKTDITPGLGAQLVGYGYDMLRPAESVTDTLNCECVALSGKDGVFFIINCDLLRLSESVNARVREGLRERFGAEADRVMMIATHTHTGPAAEDAFGRGEADKGYVLRLGDQILGAAEQAYADLLEVTAVETVETPIEPIGYNRAIPGGPEDHAVRGVRFSRGDAPLVAVLSYACHPVTMGPKPTISADYPGQVVRALDGVSVRALFVTGACGDIDPVVNRKAWGSGDAETARAYGERIANAFQTARCERTEKIEDTFRFGMVEELLYLTPMDLARVKTIAQESVDKTSNQGLIRVIRRWEQVMGGEDGLADAETGHAHYLAWGPLLLVAMGFEVFTGLAQRIRAAFPDRLVIVAGNGEVSRGYLPTAEKQALGGYEVLDSAFLNMRRPIAHGASETYTDRVIAAIRRGLDG